MRYLSLFSGIEAASVAWKPLGWQCAAVSEIEKFPCAVLKHHYPDVPNLGDVTKITEQQIQDLGTIDLVVFGFPCQDLSVAGKRAGLKGERSGLFYDAMRIVRWSGARFAVAENVPGLFSSEQGRDFAAVVGEMAGVWVDVPDGGWENAGVLAGADALVEWAVLDAQFAGVPQRRRRVFLVRDIGDWASRPPLFLIQESVQGHPAPRREAGKGLTHELAPCLGASGRGFERAGETRGQDPVVAVASTGDISHCLNAGGMGRQDYETETLIAHSLRGEGFDASEDGTGRGTPLVPIAIQGAATRENPESGPDGIGVRTDGQAFTLEARSEVQAVAFNLRGRDGGAMPEVSDVASLRAASGGSSRSYIAHMAVRRLTPVECERLQGFPRGYTKITEKTADGPRYKALGNSMAVPVMRWIAERILEANHD